MKPVRDEDGGRCPTRRASEDMLLTVIAKIELSVAHLPSFSRVVKDATDYATATLLSVPSSTTWRRLSRMDSGNVGVHYVPAGDSQLTTQALQLQLIGCVNSLIQSTVEADHQRQELLTSALNGVSATEFSRRMNTVEEKLDRLTVSIQTLAAAQSTDRAQLSRACTAIEAKIGLRLDFSEKAIENRFTQARQQAQEETKNLSNIFKESHVQCIRALGMIYERVGKLQAKLGVDLDGNADSTDNTLSATISERVDSLGKQLIDVLDRLKDTNDRRMCSLFSTAAHC